MFDADIAEKIQQGINQGSPAYIDIGRHCALFQWMTEKFGEKLFSFEILPGPSPSEDEMLLLVEVADIHNYRYLATFARESADLTSIKPI